MSAAFIDELRAALGPDAVRTGADIPVAHHTDWSGVPPIEPRALLLPADTGQVAQALRICHARRVPVVPQGGLTGLAGGAAPSPGCAALSLARMNVIESLDPAAATVQAQAGVTLQALQEAARAQGMLFGVDIGARGSCQIGGNISTNAGGTGVLQYGMMREQVLGLEVVLSDGTVLNMLRPMIKNNTGYDLKHWFIGAEGTLGVITRAVLRLHPAPAARATALLGLPGYEDALAVLGRLQQRFPGALAAFELMWDDFYTRSLQWMQARSALSDPHPFYALVDVTGDDAAGLAEALQDSLGQAMEDGHVCDAVVAQSETQAANLWRIREAPAEFPSRMDPINFDIGLPLAKIGEAAQACVDALLARWPQQMPPLRFGHIGDGNLHITVNARDIAAPSRDEAIEQVERIIYDLVARAGGSISAEHGIGTIKKPFLPASRTPAELAAMRAIKQALDPLNLLNPGKILDL